MSWRRAFEEDIFRLAFPAEHLDPKDKVEVEMSWSPGESSYAYSSWTYEPGSDADFWIKVTWKPAWKDPREGHPGTRIYFGVVQPEPQTRWFHRNEAINLWMRLMRED